MREKGERIGDESSYPRERRYIGSEPRDGGKIDEEVVSVKR